jgi:hypothetical protein
MELVPVTAAHVEYLADNLKPDHQRELAWFGMGNRRGVRASIEACRGHTLAAVHKDTLLFIAGVQQGASLYGDAAVITYLATADYDRHVVPALRMTRRLFEVDAWKHTQHQRIEQYIPPPYKAGIRFLEFLGWKTGGLVYIDARQAIHMYFDKDGDNGRT